MKRIWVMAVLLACAAAFASDEKPRAFITDSQSWEIRGSSGGSSAGFGGHVAGGARPQTAEIIKTFGERCPEVTVNNKQSAADYVVLLDHEGGKGLIRRDNKVAVFNKAGDSIVSHSTRSLGSAVKEACDAITSDWRQHASQYRAAPDPASTTPGAAQVATPANTGTQSAGVEVTSTPSGADIEVDGNFVGSTPSTLALTPGQHAITIKKRGYKPWERKMAVSSGHVKIDAELEKSE